ncbi:glucosyltransferase domain-containing protein [Paenibacillus sp. NPDC057934]|uniref:glucosyltransferase domain-containing protein n=1 Tax=Paenibacillus sp. NPDC057934 TaxID=3346282 RepID=UPI0036DF3316
MEKQAFKVFRFLSFLILGFIVIYCGLSFVIFGKFVLEQPRVTNEINISTNQLYSGLKDFDRKENTITSNSTDPWITLTLEKALSIKEIYIEVSKLSTNISKAQIYYANNDEEFSAEKYYNIDLIEGSNRVEISDSSKIKSLRLDLTDTKGVSVSISGVKIIPQTGALILWTLFIVTSIIYGWIVYRAFYPRSVGPKKNNITNHQIFKDILLYQDTSGLKLLGISFSITLLYYLPYITNTLYSIDDYYLNQLYNINIQTLGYNFNSTGRYMESVLAEIFYKINIQPLTKPLGPLLFIASMSLLGVHFTRILKINSFKIALGFVLLFTTNPFLAEIFHYSIIPAYSAFAVLALCIGVVLGEAYTRDRKIYLAILSILAYVISLTIYQIFFPVVFLIFLYKLIVPDFMSATKLNQTERYSKRLVPVIIYISSFIVYTVILKVSFYIWPPTLEYSGNNISEILSNIMNIEYWHKIYGNIQIYIMKDNPFNSGIINWILWIFSFGSLVLFIIKKGAAIEIPAKKIGHVFIAFMLITILGLFVCLGFSMLRPVEISSRSLTAFGIYQSILLLITLNLLASINTKPFIKKSLISLMVLLILFGNMGRIGRTSMDQYRLNTLEKSLVTRIVSRLEINPEFSPNAKLVIVGSPAIGNIAQTTWGDYNVPAIQQFSKVFLFNEITGYNFTMPNAEEIEKANTYLESMESWPSTQSIKSIDGIFIIKLP